jgi:pimeloyl-ACP methyl ester carboxylesterase
MFTKYIDVGPHAINFLHTGPSTLPGVVPSLDAGQLLVMLHGAGGAATLWRSQLEHFEGEHSAVALDFPGHGRSSGVDGLPTVADYTDVLVAFVQRVGLRPFVTIGRSLGGAVALTLALEHPELVRGLVVVATGARFEIADSVLESTREVVSGRRGQQFTTEAFSPTTGPEIMRRAWVEQVKTDPRVLHTDLLACRSFDVRRRLREIQVPTLVVAGADDRVMPVAAAEDLAAAIRGAELAVVPDAGQMVALEQAEKFNRLVEDFLERLP